MPLIWFASESTKPEQMLGNVLCKAVHGHPSNTNKEEGEAVTKKDAGKIVGVPACAFPDSLPVRDVDSDELHALKHARKNDAATHQAVNAPGLAECDNCCVIRRVVFKHDLKGPP